jgi:hypothetical protein
MALFAPMADAQEGNFGLGLIIGDPTGVTGKHHLGGNPLYLDWAVGFPVLAGRGLHAHVDFLWQPRLTRVGSADLDLYFGVGPKIYLDDNNLWLAARAPLGIDFVFRQVPLDVFIEVAASLYVVQDVAFDLDAAAGIRYWF